MEQKQGGLVSNVLAIIGFIILIAIIIWGAFHLLNIASSGFTSLFSGASADKITVTPSAKKVASGEPVDIAWKHTATSGTYALTYACKGNMQFRIPVGADMRPIPCGGTYTVGNTQSKSVRLIPIMSGTSTLDVPLSIIYIDSATSTSGTRPQGSTTITVTSTNTGTTGTQGTSERPSFIPPTNTPTPSTATPRPQPTAPTAPSTPPRKADLSVRIIAAGVIDPVSGAFVQRAPLSPSEIVAVKFDIANIGGTPTGSWYFSADLPTSPAQPYVSPVQQSLGAGDHIENTLRFNLVAQGGGTFTVRADSTGTVNEISESNNTASQFVVGGVQYQYGY